jgi:hypothetical protein
MRGRTVAFAMLALLAAGTSNVEAQDFEWQNAMRAGQVLEVKGIVGEIRAEYTSGSTAEVVAIKEGDPDDFDEVEIRVEQNGDGYKVCAVYHAHSADSEGCDNNHSGNSRENRHSIDVEVNYVVRVPAGVELDAGIVSGDIVAEGLRSEVHAGTVNGDIYISTSEMARANTVSGSIEVEMGATEWEHLSFNTVSGDITVWLPAGIDTDVDFESLSGDIDSDFDITMTSRRSRRWIGAEVEGYIGSSGERELTFNTVSGDVTLKQSR